MPVYVELTKSSRNLKQKNTTIFKWAGWHQKSSEKLKVVLTNSETMVYCIPDAETKVIVAASLIGL